MDMKYDQNVRIEDGEAWAEVSVASHSPEKQSKGLKVIGTSAKNGDGIDVIFEEILAQLQKTKVPGAVEKRDRSATITLNKNNVNTNTGTSNPTGAGGKKEGTGKKGGKGCCG